jgi:hypothetical protein
LLGGVENAKFIEEREEFVVRTPRDPLSLLGRNQKIVLQSAKA